MTYYKLTSRDLKSYTHTSLPLEVTVQYVIGEWVQPKVPGSSLMVFKDLSSLMGFRSFGSSRVFEVEARDASEFGVFLLGLKPTMSLSLYRILAKETKKRSCEDFVAIPRGTLFAGAVKLIKEIKVL